MEQMIPKQRIDEIKKQRFQLIFGYLEGLKVVFEPPTSDGQLSRDFIVQYYEALNDIGEWQLMKGFDHALKHFIPAYGVKFPVPAMIREWALSYQPDPEKGPPVYEPEVTSIQERTDYAKQLIQAISSASSAVHIGRVLDVYSSAYLEHASQEARRRLGGSEIPKDHDERASWTTGMAKKQGWLE